MRSPIQAEMHAKTRMKDRLAEAEQYRLARLAQSAAKPERPERKRLPEGSALRKLVVSLGHTVVIFPLNPR